MSEAVDPRPSMIAGARRRVGRRIGSRKSVLRTWGGRFVRKMRRWAEEFPSAWRALQPAWPVALIAAASSVLLLVPRQGREVLDVTVDVFRDGANISWAWFALALLFLHSLMMMGAAFFLLSIDRRSSQRLEHDLAEDDSEAEAEEATARTPQDPLSPSIALRTRAALTLGLLLPACLYVALVGSYAVDGLINIPSLWWLAMWVVAAAAVILASRVRKERSLIWALPIGVLLAGAAAMARALFVPGGAPTDNVFGSWAPWMTAAAAASAWELSARLLNWMSHRRIEEIHAAHAAREDKNKPISVRVPGVLYAMGVLSRYPTRHIIGLIIVLAVIAAFPRDLEIYEDYRRFAAGGSAVVAVIAAVLAIYSLTRARLMRVHDGQGERRLVVDRRAERYYRGAALLCLLLVPIALWPPPIYRAIGPVAVLLVGTIGVSVVLVWFVRAAISPTQPQFFAPTSVPWQGRPLFLIGAASERLQGVLTPSRVLAIGLALLLADWFVISSVASLVLSAPLVAYVLAAFAVIVVLLISAGTALLLRGSRPKPRASAIFGAIATSSLMVAIPAAAAFLNIEPGWPPADTAAALALALAFPVIAFQLAAVWDRLRVLGRRDPIRVPTVLMIAPFVIMGLGENHYLAMTPSVASDASEQVPSAPLEVLGAKDHARAWLDARVPRDANGQVIPSTEPITAIVVLAEGGGIRAASHAGLTLAHLDAQYTGFCSSFAEPRPALCRAGSAGLLDQIYAMSGVSGGSVGLAAYLAARADAAGDAPDPDLMLKQVNDTVGADHVSALFAGMFAVDLPIVLLPTQLPHDLFRGLEFFRDDYRYTWINRRRGVFDRADFFERSLGHAWLKNSQTDWFEEPFETVVAEAGRRSPGGVAPIVMFGTFEARDAHLAAASNVGFDQCPYGDHFEPDAVELGSTAEAVSQPVDDYEVLYSEFASVQDCFPPNRIADGMFVREITMPLSTAAHLSARFPGSNPSAVFDTYDEQDETWTERRFVDGGYYDNSGSTGALHALRALEAAAREAGVADRLRVVVLHIFTREVQTPPDPDARPPRDSVASEIVTPFNAVWSARDRSGRQPVRMLCQYIGASDPTVADRICEGLDDFRQASPPPDRAPPTDEPAPPEMTACRAAVVAEVLHRQSPAPRYAVSWVNAPLDIADRPESTVAEYALLGWSLKEQTQTYTYEVTKAASLPTLTALAEAVQPGSVPATDRNTVICP